MPDAQFYWNLFLETGAPEAYLSYKNALNEKVPAEQQTEEETHVF